MAYRAVRLAVLQSDPDAFLTDAAEFAARPLEDLAQQIMPKPAAVTLGAFLDGELVGVLTLVRGTQAAVRHRAEIFAVGVLEKARGQGSGDALVRAALAQAGAWDGVTVVNLAIMETQSAARRLYERCGFVLWGVQPDAVRREGRSLSDFWMARHLPWGPLFLYPHL